MSDLNRLEADSLCAEGPPIPTRTHWVTRSGRSIPIRLMTDTHLGNVLRMLRRRLVHEAYPWAKVERGADVERAMVEQEWPELVGEAKGRGLEW